MSFAPTREKKRADDAKVASSAQLAAAEAYVRRSRSAAGRVATSAGLSASENKSVAPSIACARSRSVAHLEASKRPAASAAARTSSRGRPPNPVQQKEPVAAPAEEATTADAECVAKQRRAPSRVRAPASSCPAHFLPKAAPLDPSEVVTAVAEAQAAVHRLKEASGSACSGSQHESKAGSSSNRKGAGNGKASAEECREEAEEALEMDSRARQRAAAEQALVAELRGLKKENEELQFRLHAGPQLQAWVSWLSEHADRTQNLREKRVLLLKGRLLQEEWSARQARRALAKQQAFLLRLQSAAAHTNMYFLSSGGVGEQEEAEDDPIAESQLRHALQCGHQVLQEHDDAEQWQSEPQRTCLLRPLFPLVSTDGRGTLIELHRRLAVNCALSAHLRSCISALLALALDMQKHPEKGAEDIFDSKETEMKCKAAEPACTRRETKRHLRQAYQEVQRLAARWRVEMQLLRTARPTNSSSSCG
eukprot:TRINITY_DN31835_c0_g1_i1.p1 TRINITY_DN31835_c0_g1~~TRINITY_DN31835_c0_g1_i1.p1  ORF type:complete len:511 (+),score=82.79 TRINITY_DN31835_c0_g1_i1:99-1535(+)